MSDQHLAFFLGLNPNWEIEMSRFVGKFQVIPLSLDAEGRGPEEDPSKICKIVYQIWDEACQTHSEYDNETEALEICNALNTGRKMPLEKESE